jgi:hypothetical protein
MNPIQEKVKLLMGLAETQEGLGSDQVQEIIRVIIADAIADVKQGTDELHVHLAISSSLVSLHEETDISHEIALETVAMVMDNLSMAEAENENIFSSIILGALEGASLHKYQAILKAEAQLETLEAHIKDEKKQLRKQLQYMLGHLTSKIPAQWIAASRDQKLASQLDCLYLQQEDNLS